MADTQKRRLIALGPPPSYLVAREQATMSASSANANAFRKPRANTPTALLSCRRRVHPRAAQLWLAVDSLVLLLAVFLRAVAAAEDAVDIRPVWLPLEGQGDAVAELFRSGEVVQMYHLQVRAVHVHALCSSDGRWGLRRCSIFRER